MINTEESYNNYINEKGLERLKADKNTIWVRHLSFGVKRAAKFALQPTGHFKFNNTSNNYLRKQHIREKINNTLPAEIFDGSNKILYYGKDSVVQKEIQGITVKAKIDYIIVNKEGEKVILFFDNFDNGAFYYRNEEGVSIHDAKTVKYWAQIIDEDIDKGKVMYLDRDKNQVNEYDITLNPDDGRDLKEEIKDVKKCIEEPKKVNAYQNREAWMDKYSPFA